MPADCDSTAWALLGTDPNQQPERDNDAIRFLRRGQHDGGFVTYPAAAVAGLTGIAPASSSFSGWTEPHTCVTASVVRALASRGLDETDPAIGQALSFLRERRHRDGLWPSYWWAGPAFCTYQSLWVLARFGGLSAVEIADVAKAVAARQNTDGGWAWDGWTGHRSGAFETAFAVLTLQVGDAVGVANTAGPRQAGCRWLVDHQRRDGSWSVERILRVPDPGDRVERLRVAPVPGRPGDLGADEERVFTAAAALRCLRLTARTAARRGDVQRVAQRPPRDGSVEDRVRAEARSAFRNALRRRGLMMDEDTAQRIRDADRDFARRRLSRATVEPGAALFVEGWVERSAAPITFGVGLARIFAAAADVSTSPAKEELCAVFMLGTAALDHLCDESPRLRAELLPGLSVPALRRWCFASPDATWTVGAQSPDVRYVLGLVGEFFARMRDVIAAGPTRTRLAGMLEVALRAELGTFDGGCDDDFRLARAVPLDVVALISCAPRTPTPRALPRQLATAFSAVDDLADLTMDARSRTANAFLDQPRWRSSSGPRGVSATTVLRDVLDRGVCMQAAEFAAQELDRATALLPIRSSSGIAPRERLVAHSLGWGNLRVSDGRR